ncbi:unnamed protein product [Cylindrotheca closterium]|uniref:Uncharacterized protein n=1 Tax=Cylindrotheca closterium TaxID=2856 RepID=A0AAD2CHG3_9STRA|nr:unnamed protein product [Cylindrotheca closterium]
MSSSSHETTTTRTRRAAASNTTTNTTTSTEMDSQMEEELEMLVETNNRAVALLEKGDFEPAISTFARALTLARATMTKNQATQSSNKLAAVSFDECMERSRAARLQLGQKNKDVEKESESEQETCHLTDGSKAFLYNTAMQVQSSDLPATTFESHVFMSVVLVFNAALAYQLAGDQLLQEDLSNVIFVRKSIKLYRLAYNIYHEETVGASPYFCMAIVNNLGLLYQENHCGDKADKCFQHLLSTLMFLVDCKENMEHFEGYFENTSHLFFPTNKRLAPAA